MFTDEAKLDSCVMVNQSTNKKISRLANYLLITLEIAQAYLMLTAIVKE